MKLEERRGTGEVPQKGGEEIVNPERRGGKRRAFRIIPCVKVSYLE